MAALQGTDAFNFALDIGTNFKKITQQEPDAVEIFASKSGLGDDTLAQILSWTGERVGNFRMRFRNEIMVSRALRSPVMRGCPICLRGRSRDQRPPLQQMVMQGSWLCRGVDVCLEHSHVLVPLWREPALSAREDIAAHLTKIWPDLRDGRLDQDPITATPYDHWLDTRLSRLTDPSWLAGQPLFAAMTFCSLLGVELRRVQGLPEDDREAKAIGFHFASRGPTAIEEAFARLTGVGNGAPDVNRQVVGALYDKLEHLYREDPSFDGFRALLRAQVIQIWPVAAGDMLLGQRVEVRRVHSILTASQETGVTTTALDALLTEAGVFERDDIRPPSRKTFDVKLHADLRCDLTTLVNTKTMRETIGATEAELDVLVEEGYLVARSRRKEIKKPWHLPDGQSLVDELGRFAEVFPPDAKGWQTILMAARRSGLTVRTIIEAIREGRVQAARRPDVFGYHGIVVELAALAMFQEHYIAAAAFARSIGLRGSGAFTALIERGHINVTQVTSPKTGRSQWLISDDAIADFRQRFVTPAMITEETGIHHKTIHAVLSAAGLKRFRPDGVDVGPVFLREGAMLAISNYLKKR